MLRRAVGITLSLLLCTPMWASSNPLGTIAAGRDVTVAGTAAANGSTLYNGDTLSVLPNGNLSMILAGGARARLAGNSEARLSRTGSAISLELFRGKAEFTSNGNSPVEGRIADATFRPENPSSTSVAFMTLDSSNHTVLYADKGAWIVTTAHDGHSMILQPGTHIEGVLGAVPVQNQTPDTVQGQQQQKKKRKWGVIWIGTGIIGTATGLGMAFGMSECNVNSGPGCVSAVNPGAPPQAF